MSYLDAGSGPARDMGVAGSNDIETGRRPAEPIDASSVHDLGYLIQVASSALRRIARHPSLSVAPSLDPVIDGATMALQRAGMLVSDTIARAEVSGRSSAPADIGTTLEQVASLVRKASAPNIRVELRIDAGLPPADCASDELLNAVLGLVLNARDAMPDGGLIRISAAAALRGEKGLLVLRIEDGGIGMSRETAVRAFEPFFTTKGRGLGGLGLPMVKRFADEHGGSVEIESTSRAGTSVILRVPAHERATGH